MLASIFERLFQISAARGGGGHDLTARDTEGVGAAWMLAPH